MTQNFTDLRIALQSLGLKVPADTVGRSGGAGPSEGRVVIVNNQYISVPTDSWFVKKSPYRVVRDNDKFQLFKNKTAVCEVSFPAVPHYYRLKSTTGIDLNKVALVHGRDCFASTVYQNCSSFERGMECKFCGILLSLENNQTIETKDPELLAETALKAMALDHVTHVTLTSGQRATAGATISHLADCVFALKQKTSLPIHVQICPTANEADYVSLKNAGVDTLGIHIETCNMALLREIAPMKAKLGIDFYRRAWHLGVKHFGANQVSSFIIAGIGNSPADISASTELMARNGVFPFVLPFRPIPGTRLEHLKPLPPEIMKNIYRASAAIIKKYNLSSRKSKAGCVRCGTCSAITEFV